MVIMERTIGQFIARLILISTILYLASCGSTEYKHKPTDTTFTTVKVVRNVVKSEYADFTLMKIYYDTTKIKGDRVEWYRDSVYKVGVPDKDTAKHIVYWNEVPKEFIVIDYMKRWPLQAR